MPTRKTSAHRRGGRTEGQEQRWEVAEEGRQRQQGSRSNGRREREKRGKQKEENRKDSNNKKQDAAETEKEIGKGSRHIFMGAQNRTERGMR